MTAHGMPHCLQLATKRSLESEQKATGNLRKCVDTMTDNLHSGSDWPVSSRIKLSPRGAAALRARVIEIQETHLALEID